MEPVVKPLKENAQTRPKGPNGTKLDGKQQLLELCTRLAVEKAMGRNGKEAPSIMKALVRNAEECMDAAIENTNMKAIAALRRANRQ